MKQLNLEVAEKTIIHFRQGVFVKDMAIFCKYVKYCPIFSDLKFFFSATDFEFANTRYGKPVAFGVAGDCYSRSNCPQVCQQLKTFNVFELQSLLVR